MMMRATRGAMQRMSQAAHRRRHRIAHRLELLKSRLRPPAESERHNPHAVHCCSFSCCACSVPASTLQYLTVSHRSTFPRFPSCTHHYPTSHSFFPRSLYSLSIVSPSLLLCTACSNLNLRCHQKRNQHHPVPRTLLLRIPSHQAAGLVHIRASLCVGFSCMRIFGGLVIELYLEVEFFAVLDLVCSSLIHMMIWCIGLITMALVH